MFHEDEMLFKDLMAEAQVRWTGKGDDGDKGYISATKNAIAGQDWFKARHWISLIVQVENQPFQRVCFHIPKRKFSEDDAKFLFVAYCLTLDSADSRPANIQDDKALWIWFANRYHLWTNYITPDPLDHINSILILT